MRVVFFGTPELAVPSLETVAPNHDVTAVVCQPDRPKGRSGKPAQPPTKRWALEHGIEVAQPVKLNDGAFEAWLKTQRPDVCCLCAYGRILKQPILDVPPHGFLNVHPSLLPKYRGMSPIPTAILNGDSVTGVTIMRMDAGMDTGDILLREELPIASDDTTSSLSVRLGTLGAELLVRGLALVASNQAVFTPQEHSQATLTKRFEKSDGRIHWAASAQDIHNLVRAMIPWPVAHCIFAGEVCRVHETAVIAEAPAAPPGTVVRVENERLCVATGAGLLGVRVIQMPGKRAMSVADFLRGHTIARGDRFEDITGEC